MALTSRFVAYHTDIARGAYLRPDALKQLFGLAADAGFTHVIPYLENMIQLPAIAKACPPCAYSPESWRDLEAAAEAVGVELVPHFNVIGHSHQICRAYPELAGEPGACELDTSTDLARTFTRDALVQFCDFASSPWFLIGGDEWQTPIHLLQNPGFNVARAWAEHVNLAIETLVAAGRTPIVWHDMLMHFPEALELLSRDAVIAFWFYDVDTDYAVIRTLQEHGFQVIMASGTVDGCLSHRRLDAMKQAVAVARETSATGFMMTSWELQRFEDQALIIGGASQVMRGQSPPEAILCVDDLRESLRAMGQPMPSHDLRLRQLHQWLDDPAWAHYPLARQVRRHWLERDLAADLEAYTRFHYPHGPLYDTIRHGRHLAPRHHLDGLTLHTEQAEPEGVCLTIRNGAEHLRLYPRYGPTLQDWVVDSQIIIPHSLPTFIEPGRPTGGGYRSYNGVGGLRPIWALGTHHNPCILWQYMWDWDVEDESPERIVIRLSQSFHHVDMVYRLTVTAGEPGFRIDLAGTNKLDHARIGFNWNICCAYALEDMPYARFTWQADGAEHEYRLAQESRSAFMLRAPGALTLETARYRLHLDPGPHPHSYFVDSSASLITPDLRSEYQPMHPGEALTTTWHFRARPRTLAPVD